MLKCELYSVINRFPSAAHGPTLSLSNYSYDILLSPHFSCRSERASWHGYCLSQLTWTWLFVLNMITCWGWGSSTSASMKGINKKHLLNWICRFWRRQTNSKLQSNADKRNIVWQEFKENGIKWHIARHKGDSILMNKSDVRFKIKDHTWGIFFKLSMCTGKSRHVRINMHQWDLLCLLDPADTFYRDLLQSSIYCPVPNISKHH